MRSLIQPILAFLKDENGPTAVEYAVMLAAILLMVIGTVRTLGTANGALWTSSQTQLEEAGF